MKELLTEEQLQADSRINEYELSLEEQQAEQPEEIASTESATEETPEETPEDIPVITQPEPQHEEEPEVILTDEDERLIISKTYELFSQNPKIQEVLKELEMDIPTTREEWKALYDEDSFTYNELLKEFNNIKENVSEALIEIKTEHAKYDANFNKNVTEVASNLKKIIDTASGGGRISPKVIEEIGSKLDEFYAKNENNPEYIIEKYGLKYIDTKKLIGGFLSENPDILTKVKATETATTGVSAKEGGEAQEIASLLTKGKSSVPPMVKNLNNKNIMSEQELEAEIERSLDLIE